MPLFHHQTLAAIANNYSPLTKVYEVPRGTTVWRIAVEPERDNPFTMFDPISEPLVIKTIDIQLEPVFGMMVGYNKEWDTLVYWHA